MSQRLLLEGLTGYAPLRALGETFLVSEHGATFRPWLLAILPAMGGLVSGLLTTRFAPEASGGGGDAIDRELPPWWRGARTRPAE